MKRFDFAVCVMSVAFATFVVGCGGGAPESSQPATPPAQAEPAPPPAAEPPPAASAAPEVPPPPTTEAAYQTTMKMVSDHMRNLREHQKGQMLPEMAMEAKLLAQLFTGVESFWTGRNTADAIGFAKAAVGASQSIAAAADAKDMAKAEAGIKTLDTQCQSCHKAHRVQDGDYFSMK
jgi:hypothetical protein